MNRRYLFLLIVIPMFFCSLVYADSSGTVSRLVCHVADVSRVCQVELNDSKSAAACATSNWHYTFDGATVEGQNVLSIILAAQLSKQRLYIGGKGTCTLTGSSEDLRHVYISTPS